MDQTQENSQPGIGSRATGRLVELRLVRALLNPWQRVQFFFLVAERIGLGLCDLLLAAAMYLLFRQLQSGASTHVRAWLPGSARTITAWTIGIVGIRLLLDLSSARSATKFTQTLYAELLLRLTRGYGELRWNRFVQRNRSELIKHAMTTALDASFSYQIYLEMIAGVVVVLVMAAALVYQSPFVTAGLASIIALLYLLHRYVLRGQLQGAARDREEALRKLQRILTDVLSASKEIRTYANQDVFYDRLRRQAEALGTSNVKLALLPQISRVLAEQGVVLLFLGIIFGVLLRGGDMPRTLSLLIFYFVVSRRMLPIISQVALLNSQREGAYENLRITHQELQECRLHRRAFVPEQMPGPGFALQLENVAYSFDDGLVVLDGITLDLRLGETVLLRGVSGSGKSSLLNLIAGVSQPSAGVLRIDRSNVAYVPQEIALLDDSIRSNLQFGLPAQSEGRLLQALAAANLEDFVSNLPERLETRVGDGGVLLSGGQRQRLGIARAMLREASLLLLDEATSALDEGNEREILTKLAASGRTVLLVTHRRSSSRIAHRVFQLQDGKMLAADLSDSATDLVVSRS